MSESKLYMVQKLARVQEKLMGVNFSDTKLQTLLPIIFKECHEENMVFWFNFIDNACVLNLRDVLHDNYELNIRLSIGELPVNGNLHYYKEQVLINAFLILPDSINVNGIPILEEIPKEETVKEEPIEESNMVPPSAIRVAIEECKQNGEPINKKNLESKLNLKGMNHDKRRQCIAYLRGMGE